VKYLPVIWGLAIFLILPVVVDSYTLTILISVFYYAYLSSCWNILGGYAGQLSLGHAAFFGIGAYTSSLLFMQWHLTPWLGMWIGALLATIFALFMGSLSFRFGLRGFYFVLVTWAFAELLRLITLSLDILGGPTGIYISAQTSPWQFQFSGRRPYYYIILGLTTLLLIISHKLEASKLGFYFKAIRENELAAEGSGVATARYKLLALAISAFMTALGGTFYAQYLKYIDPETTLGVSLSIEIMIRAMIGGSGTLFGPLIGSFILTPLSELSRTYFTKGGLEGLPLVIYGVVLIFIVLFLPQGIATWIMEKTARYKNR
jgi:branched-chain amino acid transport system permease protein